MDCIGIKKIIIPCVILIFLCSCASGTVEKFNSLKDKTFYFQKLRYFKKGLDKKKAFKIMKDFPASKILKLIANKYGITADAADFEDFILSENLSAFNSDGLLFDVDFIWENKNKHSNIISIEYKQVMNSLSMFEEEYKIIITSDGNNLETLYWVPNEKKSELENLAKCLGYSRLKDNSDDYYINDDNKSIVSLIPTKEAEEKKTKTAKNKITREKIRQQIKEYVNTMPSEEKKKFRDDLIKFLYSVIE